MTIMTTLHPLLWHLAAWIQTPDGSNIAFALLCAAALVGVPSRLCLGLTLLLHLSLVLL